MPVSATQHRATTGTHQNQLFENSRRGNPTHTPVINRDSQHAQRNQHDFPLVLTHVGNSLDVMSRPTEQLTLRQSTALLSLQLLSLICHGDSPLPSASGNSALDSGRYVIQNTPNSDNSFTGFSAMLNPVANALYETGQFIARNDPLKFPAADAAPLCSGSHLPDDFVTFLNSNGMNVVARGLEQLKCIEHDKYEFFKGVSFNSINLLDSAIKQLEGKKNNELDNHLRYYGIVDIDDVKPRLVSLYKKIKYEIGEILSNKRDSIYYGYGSMTETAATDALVKINDKDRRIFLTDNFFAKCTVNAINTLIHEMSHFHTKLDLFQVIKQKSCLDKTNGGEIPIHVQLDDSSDFYTHSIRPLKEDGIVTDGHIQFAYNMNKKEFVDIFNTNKTAREEAIFINADTISNLAIAIGNYGFKRDNVMPLLDTSEFKTGKPIES